MHRVSFRGSSSLRELFMWYQPWMLSWWEVFGLFYSQVSFCTWNESRDQNLTNYSTKIVTWFCQPTFGRYWLRVKIHWASQHGGNILISNRTSNWLAIKCRFGRLYLLSDVGIVRGFGDIPRWGWSSCKHLASRSERMSSEPGEVSKPWLKSFRNTTPGGYIEIEYCEFPFRCKDGTMLPASAIVKWTSLLQEASIKVNRRFDGAAKHQEELAKAGFTDITAIYHPWPLNSWPRDRRYREIGRWVLENVTMGTEALSMGLFTRILGWRPVCFSPWCWVETLEHLYSWTQSNTSSSLALKPPKQFERKKLTLGPWSGRN